MLFLRAFGDSGSFLFSCSFITRLEKLVLLQVVYPNVELR